MTIIKYIMTPTVYIILKVNGAFNEFTYCCRIHFHCITDNIWILYALCPDHKDVTCTWC